MKKRSRYIPAFHFRWLTPWYDPMMRRLYPESALKAALIAQAHIQSGQNVLDVGCGTGTLTLLIKQTHPNVAVYGLDVDSEVLDIARRKAEQAGQTIFLQQGTATCLPYPDGHFDRVFASLMLHHLTREDKRHALAETFRVLKPGGELHVADFGEPGDPSMWLISLVVRWVEEVHDNVLGLLPVFMAESGFKPVGETASYRTVSGALALYRACKPAVDRT
ncbi:class I SAM-dependent methyltransferase [Methylococcus geothermalis]|uniref:Methyltransferase domain-containing protein n=1 Tax=Methylococcus geothermalis TaxID=2681310 RepID=A0A858Q9J2_9GAMM|nr:class I SAM-dependent methyltransferase [Methylococcus geothermalis]QJD30582.1 methyltransferase domain-containing protein [Methylococcus geothermalis]